MKSKSKVSKSGYFFSIFFHENESSHTMMIHMWWHRYIRIICKTVLNPWHCYCCCFFFISLMIPKWCADPDLWISSKVIQVRACIAFLVLTQNDLYFWSAARRTDNQIQKYKSLTGWKARIRKTKLVNAQCNYST